MMIKKSDLPGVKVFKSFKELIGHISDELGKIHNKAHLDLQRKATLPRPKTGAK